MSGGGSSGSEAVDVGGVRGSDEGESEDERAGEEEEPGDECIVRVD
jgi:hypothetical protein